MIRNARDVKLNASPSGVPNVAGGILDWLRPMTFAVITKSVVNFANVETSEETTVLAMRQPLSAQRLSMKPEGQRSWKWEMIHALPELVLSNDDKVRIDGVEYRVMAKTDFTENGYVMYEIAQDYT